MRYKFVTPDESTQPGYGFVQFAHRKDAHLAIKSCVLSSNLFPFTRSIYEMERIEVFMRFDGSMESID